MALVEYCCCCCDKSKRKVEDDVEGSDPLLTDEEKADAKYEEKGQVEKRRNPTPRADLMKKNMTVGDIEIDSSDDDVSDMTGVPHPLDMMAVEAEPQESVLMGTRVRSAERVSLRRVSNETAGSITIPDGILKTQGSIRSLARSVSESMTDGAATSSGKKSSPKASKPVGDEVEKREVRNKRVSIQEGDEKDEDEEGVFDV